MSNFLYAYALLMVGTAIPLLGYALTQRSARLRHARLFLGNKPRFVIAAVLNFLINTIATLDPESVAVVSAYFQTVLPLPLPPEAFALSLIVGALMVVGIKGDSLK